MALYVNTNISSINAQRKLTNATNSLNTTYQRLASGLRINSAKDDAAGLQISNRLTTQINGLNQGNRNANDGIALAQTAEGAMEELTTMLQRIRTLANQAATGTNTEADRLSLQEEVTQLSEEINRISRKTTYAGQTLLSGASDDDTLLVDGRITLQVGANSYDTISIGMSQGFSIIQMFSTIDLDYNVAANAGASANYGLVRYEDTLTTGSGGTETINSMRFSVSTADAAQQTLYIIDSFIQVVDSKRAELGAVQNRLESTIRNQSSISENESDARSRIRDTDFAEETANLTQQSIIQQASQSILTQANQRPQIALSLLGG